MAVYNFNTKFNGTGSTPSNITQGDTLVFQRTSTESRFGSYLTWTVPYTGKYRIKTKGAQGSTSRASNAKPGGKGAVMEGTFFLNQGEVLRILVGHMPPNNIRSSSNAYGGSGGGGTFVAKRVSSGGYSMFDGDRVIPLIIAGGGGGGSTNIEGYHGLTGTSGGTSTTGHSGGTNGNGGVGGNGEGGAGFIGNGGGGGGAPDPLSFINGGEGGEEPPSWGYGAFGGGGAGRGGAGGGGGYSGGGGGGTADYANYAGGGGGSYNTGDNQVNVSGANIGDGLVEIYFAEIINPPNKPSTITVPSTSRVGNTVNVSWASVPVPTQQAGVTLTTNQVFYEVDFYDGTKWNPVTSKTSALNVNYTIPAMADTNLAKFRVRAFVEAYGQRFYTDYGATTGYKESVTLTVYNNNRPTTPLAFSAPIASSRYRVGFSYTPSWGASTDLDNDPITYELDFFNGVSWTTIASGLQTTNRSFVVPSGPDTLNAQFRVRAYDGRDYSDYRYSDKFEVFNNTPPNTPRPFTSPLSDEMRIIDQQTAYTVAWGPADVEVGETAKYEVSFRGSSIDNWVVIQDINSPNATKTSLTHIIPNVQDSDTAQYRVRAYDGYEYGGYTESNQFSISGNKVTNTSGFNQELMDRMAINQEVRLSWQPAETTRGTQVVYDIEIFDGFTWKEIAYNVPTTSLVFRIPPMEDTPNAKIRIRSKTPFQFGGYVESEWAETPSFTIVNFFIFDSIAVPFLNDVQKKENADYLRQKVNDMRIVNDLPPLVYTDPVIIRYETAIKAVHFDEIERGILECFDTNPRGKFNNARTEQELRKVKEYTDQAELIQELPQRIDFICKALMNQ